VSNELPHCSFCNRVGDAAGDLISSPINDQLLPPAEHFVYICADCVGVCNEILEDGRGAAGDRSPPAFASETPIIDEDGPTLLPNGLPLRLQRWTRRTLRPRS
jgi:hypothetical protein